MTIIYYNMYICRSIQIICVLIKINVSGAATNADQPQINRDPNSVNRGRVLSYLTLFCTKNRQNVAIYHLVMTNIAMERSTIF